MKFSYGDPKLDTMCQEIWHTAVMNQLHCRLPPDHEGDHEGFGFSWSRSPLVDKYTAIVFIEAYRKIPNSNHKIVLKDDGTVEMDLKTFCAATDFIHVRRSED